jgi:SAM-dependent methyltransferase
LTRPRADQSVDAFITKWAASGAAERANKDAFLIELCDLLDVPRPDPTTGDPDKDVYVFEKDARTTHEGGTVSIGKADLYKEGCFILEAKQGSEAGSKKMGTAKRGTPSWAVAMKDAFGQALGYARTFEKPPPFLLVCDIGYCFDLYAVFDGTGAYRPFPNAQASRLFHKDLADQLDTLRTINLDPYALDPSRNAVRVTREVAAHLAELARTLEQRHSAETVATFLMRCLFTMFAEDVGLLPPETFTEAIEQHWLPNPPSFTPGVQTFWKAMNEGGYLFTGAKLLEFNGGLFASPAALPLDRDQLQLLLNAARCDWADVEPAIFGTLLERALDAKERHQLGAHFTPRAYVERLVRPTIEEPLRDDWDIVQAQIRQLIAGDISTDSKAGKKALKLAIKAVKDFHKKLCDTRVLDPACGSGNFLYVALDLFKRLESEILALLAELGETQTLLDMESIRVTPAQFLGIEIKRWAKEIADLVLWIGYLQWHFKTYGSRLPVPEPVLRDYHNIECRDAILAYDSEELVRDDAGKPVTRWDGESTKKHPVTGEDIPDESKQAPVYRYVNPRMAEWPNADYVVGNPPFIGNWRMRSALGDGYAETLRKTYATVPESVDYVMYWWDKAAHLTRAGKLRRFGLITTNSITQSFARKVVRPHLDAKNALSLAYAIPDHPWVDSASGADVRIAMTVSQAGEHQGLLNQVVLEEPGPHEAVQVTFQSKNGKLNSDLTAGPNVASAVPLRSNEGLSCPGVKLHGSGFIVTACL